MTGRGGRTFTKKPLAAEPALSTTQLNLFHLRNQQGRFDEAAAAMRQVLELEPDNADAHYDFGAFLLE